MHALVLRHQSVHLIDDAPEPEAGPGQLLVQTVACGICGSDLHFAQHGKQMLELAEEMGTPVELNLERDVYFGHEFVAQVIDAGGGATGPAVGTFVTSVPAILGPSGPEQIVYTNGLRAGLCERFVLSPELALPIPPGLDLTLAALTEPVAVGVHAVNRAGDMSGAAALVAGCGPVGLAVIAALVRRGVAPIVASDPSPSRRARATSVGASVLVDPGEQTLMEAYRSADRSMRPVVMFEAVGLPGVIEGLMRQAPAGTRIVVVGACMERDWWQPMFGVNKELDLRFSMAYSPEEFADTLTSISRGELQVQPLITSVVGIDQAASAFDRLQTDKSECKVLVAFGRGDDSPSS